MSAPTITRVEPFVFDDGTEVQAAFALAMNKTTHPELVKAEAKARLKLAAAIRYVDANPDLGLFTQPVLDEAMNSHAQALANLVRGDDSQSS